MKIKEIKAQFEQEISRLATNEADTSTEEEDNVGLEELKAKFQLEKSRLATNEALLVQKKMMKNKQQVRLSNPLVTKQTE